MIKADYSYLKTYRYQTVRIIISIIALLIISNFTSRYERGEPRYMLGYLLGFIALYQLFKGLSYIQRLYERERLKVKCDTSVMKYHVVSIEQIISMLAKELRLEFILLGPESLVSIGVYSEGRHNKMYYIDDDFYENLIEFERDLRCHWSGNFLKVHKGGIPICYGVYFPFYIMYKDSVY